ncbi:MAG: carboxypeptidase regulatory-like domain-containing protein [Candidatus Aminicenantales bacterium]
MRKILGILCVLLLTFPLLAQQRTGNIVGKVVDEDGNPLPGVTVTVSGSLTAPMQTITTAEGVFRFLSLAPSDDYKIKCELEGFKTTYRAPLVVVLGRNTEVVITMEMGVIEEEVTVTAASPVVESKKTQIAEHVTRERLQSLPTARDPWVVLQQTPGVMVDRENVGGSESGQQAGFFAKGGGYDQWSMDGVVITDPAAIASPTYYDFDAFDEIAITTGGQDVTIQGGGVNINLVSRRGGNRLSLGGRFYFTDEKFQSAHTGDKIDEIKTRYPGGVGYNVIKNIKDYGFNMGGPLVKDKAWWWLSYGVQDIKTNVLTGAADNTLLQNYAAKINFQLLPDNRIELFTHIGNKEKFGRSSSYSFPRGWHQTGKYHFGSPIYKVQVEQMFGANLFISVKYSFNDAGFNLIPMDDEEQNKLLVWDAGAGWVANNSYYAYNASRPSHSFYFQANYFNDDLFGMSHEFKVGFDFRHSTGTHYWSTSGNVNIYTNIYWPTLDTDGDGSPDIDPNVQQVDVWRGWRDNNTVTGYAAYFQDTITLGRLTLLLGFRWDYQTPNIGAFTKTAVEPNNGAWANNFTQGAISGIDSFLPGLEIPAISSNWGYHTWSPRIGATYDITGDGKTLLKANFARYGEFMSTGWADYFLPTYTGGWASFFWMDDGDGIVGADELYWYAIDQDNWYAPVQVFDANGNFLLSDSDRDLAEWYMWGSFDPDDPQNIGSVRYTIDEGVGSYYITEFIVSLEREILPDFGAAIDLTYRRFDNYNWTLQWDGTDPNTIRSQDDYVQFWQIPATAGGYDTEEAAGRWIWLRKEGVPNYYYRYLTKRPDYYQDYAGIELRFNKRLSNKWMLNGSVTLQTERRFYGDEGYLNPTNIWAYDGRIYAPSMGGGSGKISMRVFSHWLVKLNGLYQLPWDINVSFDFNARQGHVLQESINFWFDEPPNTLERSVTVPVDYFGTRRLPSFWNLNFRIEKVLRLGDYGRIYIMLDIFNIFNLSTENRRYDHYHGRLYVYGDGSTSFWQNPTDGLVNELLNPRVLRLGVRFQF